jgi:hypothetical protein
MGGLREWYGGFDLGEFLGIGLSTTQIAHLAGALFLALLGLSALRRVGRSSGLLPAVWVAVAVGLLAGAVLVAARGFPDDIPEEARPWTEPDRLTRAAAALALLGCSLVLLSAHWAGGAMARFASRVAGLAVAAVAVWLAAGWFADQVPEEVRDWTAQAVITRIVVILALLFLAGALWVRQSGGAPHVRWLNRSLTPPAVTVAVLMALKWFGQRLPEEVPTADVRFVTTVLGAVVTGTCLLIAGGAYLLRERPQVRRKGASPPAPRPIPLEPVARPLPVAVLLDERGRPVVPSGASRPGQAGPAGA